MDKRQLVTIAVTAAISVVSREIFMWVVSLFKNAVRSENFRETLKGAIRKHRNAIMIWSDLLGLAYAIWFFVDMIRDQHPITHLVVALISASVVNGLYWVAKLFHDAANAYDDRLDARKAKQSLGSTNAL